MKVDESEQIAAILTNRNLRWFFGGGLVSLLGDQFSVIALPWLVLKMTGDTFALGSVLAVMGIPRAVFILFGGALADLYHPKRVLMAVRWTNAVLLTTLAALVFSETVSLPLVYGFALLLGVSTAFSLPAASSMLPKLAERGQLRAVNGLLLGLRQISLTLGPLLGGFAISFVGRGKGVVNQFPDSSGVGIAFSVDAFTFMFAAWTLTRVSISVYEQPLRMNMIREVLRSAVEGVFHIFKDSSLRVLSLYYAAIAFFVSGTLQVALPLLADTHLAHGAMAFGALMAANGVGAFLGMAFAGSRPPSLSGRLGTIILLLDGVAGLLIMPLGQISATWEGIVLLVGIGASGGYIQVSVFTWIQERVPSAILGRAMAVFTFIFIGLPPLSGAIAGFVLRYVSLGGVFVGGGIVLILIVLVAFLTSDLRALSDLSLSAEEES